MGKIIVIFGLLFSTLWGASYTDMMGRVVEVKESSKLVFIGPGALRLGVYLGLDARLVGIEKTENDASPLSPYRSFLGKERIGSLPIIGAGGPGKMPDLEALIAVKPDLIVSSFVDKNALELITSKTGIPVLALSYGATYGGNEAQLQSIKNSLLLLGKVSGTSARAQELVVFMNEQQKNLAALSLPAKKVYVGGVGYKGAQGITSTEANYPPFELLGLKNSVFEGKEAMGHQFIELEALLKTNPEIIFIDTFGRKKVMEAYEANKTLFDTLGAYQNGAIKDVLSYNFYATNVENLFVIAWQIAYGLGKPFHLTQEAQKIYTIFYGPKGPSLLPQLLPQH